MAPRVTPVPTMPISTRGRDLMRMMPVVVLVVMLAMVLVMMLVMMFAAMAVLGIKLHQDLWRR